jgi:hypothetical protein
MSAVVSMDVHGVRLGQSQPMTIQTTLEVISGGGLDWGALGQILVGLVSAAVAIGAALLSREALERSDKAAKRAIRLQGHLSINDQMSRYLSSYFDLATADAVRHDVQGYTDLTPRERLQSQVVVGQLIMLVEASMTPTMAAP